MFESNYQEDKIDPITNVVSISEDPEPTQSCLFQHEEDTVDTNVTLGNQAEQLYKESFAKNAAEFNYVKHVLELSGFSGNQIIGKLHSEENPMDTSVFDEIEGHLSLSENSKMKKSRMHTTPFCRHVLDEVWTEISCFLKWIPEFGQTTDDVVSRNLAKDDGWMNLQSDAECVGIEVEDLIFDDLLEEIIFT